MKNRIALFLSLMLIFSVTFITSVEANAAMPPILTIVVVNPPHDLSLSIALTQGDQVETKLLPRFYVSTSKSIIKALINMRSFEIQLSPIG